MREILVRATRLAWVHPVVTLALGFALTFALASAFTGVGLLLFAWFACEFFALSLAASGVAVQPRGASWWKAAVIVLTVVVLWGSVVLLAAAVFGPDVASFDRVQVIPPGEAALRLCGMLVVFVLAVAFVLPFVHTPMILLERGGFFGTCVLESVLLVRRSGVWGAFRVVCAAAGIALFPAVVSAVASARVVDRASTPFGILLSIPFLLFSLPLGLGVVVQSYQLLRHLLPARRIHEAVRPSRAVVVLLALAVFVPVLSLASLIAASFLPAPLVAGPVPREAAHLAEGNRFTIPSTTLWVELQGDVVRVTPALDDAAEVLRAQPDGQRPDTVSVYHHGDAYLVELRHGSQALGHAVFDGSGSRLDDTVHRALEERVGVPSALLFAAMFVLITALLFAALAPLAEARRGPDVSDEERRLSLALVARRALQLVPCWVLLAAIGVRAIFAV